MVGMAKLIQVIETDDLRGNGTEGKPYRRVKQFFSTEGELLAEVDEWEMSELRKAKETVEGLEKTIAAMTANYGKGKE